MMKKQIIHVVTVNLRLKRSSLSDRNGNLGQVIAL